ncbi:MAG: hypothetical protein SXA11_16595 [Cyanobacteriota bacterium]|nr:hypothetical protein [Cyanobacteriota bacterium]
MKILLRITLILVLSATTGLLGKLPEAKSDPNTLAQTEDATTATPPIPVSLPALAKVTLKDGNTRSGRAIDFNSEQLTIKRDKSRATVPIADIVGVEFDGSVWWPEGTEFITIRGDDTIKKGEPVRLQVRMDGFEWVEKERGIANISSEAVVDVDGQGTENLKGILGVVNSGQIRYVISQIEFDLENKLLSIAAIATARPE